MRRYKTSRELTIKDPFMFSAVMSDAENCKGLLEMVLGISIARVEVETERTFAYHPAFHGVRLDVYAKDEAGTRFNVEMQVVRTPVGKRARYYHSQMDMEMLKAGRPYEELPDAYVIFICDYDPVGRSKYRYTGEHRIKETGERFEDGSHTILLSTCGTNKEEVPEPLVKFLEYVHADLENSEQEYQDEYVRRLQNSVSGIKRSREMEDKYMLFEEMLRMERNEGKQEGLLEGKQAFILELLSYKGEVSCALKEKICSITDPVLLKDYLRIACESDSTEIFEEKIHMLTKGTTGKSE